MSSRVCHTPLHDPKWLIRSITRKGRDELTLYEESYLLGSLFIPVPVIWMLAIFNWARILDKSRTKTKEKLHQILDVKACLTESSWLANLCISFVCILYWKFHQTTGVTTNNLKDYTHTNLLPWQEMKSTNKKSFSSWMPEVCLFLGEYFHEYTKLQNTKTITLVQIYKVDNKKDKCHEHNQYKTMSASQDDITTTGFWLEPLV